MENIEQVLKEIAENDNFMQMVRGLVFWIIEPNESRDRFALVLLAKYAKAWAEKDPPRLTPDTQPWFIKWCQEIIDAGAASDGPEMPAPWKAGV